MRGLGDKPVRTRLTHTTMVPECDTGLKKLGRFDEFAASVEAYPIGRRSSITLPSCGRLPAATQEIEVRSLVTLCAVAAIASASLGASVSIIRVITSALAGRAMTSRARR